MVLDARDDVVETLLIRTAPSGIQDPFELSVSVTDIVESEQPMWPLRDKLPGGFKLADLVFATADMGQGSPSPVGFGDAGVVFGASEYKDTHLTVRFESARDRGAPIILLVPVNGISKTPQLSQGRRVRLEMPVAFPDGQQVEVGSLGTLIDGAVDSDTPNLVVLDLTMENKRCFGAPPGSLSVVIPGKMSPEDLQVRVEMLEWLSTKNEEKGNLARNISLLEQNLWSLHGFGTGVGVREVAGSRFHVISQSERILSLRPSNRYGIDGTLESETKSQFSHDALVADQTRTDPYRKSIDFLSRGRRGLEIGTGPFCILSRLCMRSGAASMDAIEASDKSMKSAVSGLQAEQAGLVADGVPEWATLTVSSVSEGEKQPVATAQLGNNQKLEFFHGLSTDPSLQLPGGYNLLVHEILGDLAGSEGAAAVLADIHQRGLLSHDCAFVPRAAQTMLAPTAKLNLSPMAKLLHRWGHKGSSEVEVLGRYAVRYFHKQNLLAEPQPMEILDFTKTPELEQSRELVFRTERDGEFDGIHMHLHADFDGADPIDCLDIHSSDDPIQVSSWSTTYVRLLETPLRLPARSRLVCRCDVDLRGAIAKYQIAVLVGESGCEKPVADFDFQGT